ncbi:uncharacterized protein LOC134221780 [Armigeres subalbatus]|uniref:uncharacterized protein LOC134221780 n=1 Tax=Armigeres subalbatus TaxID=124917 RepID=UPI002ED64A31
MNQVFPRAEDLNSEEIDYELAIRQQPEEVFKLDLSGRQRTLRRLFKEDQKDGRNYRSPYSISEEAAHVEGRIENLTKALEKRVEIKLESRVIHYWYRVKRAVARNDEEKKLRRDLSNDDEASGQTMGGAVGGPGVSEDYSHFLDNPRKSIDYSKGAIHKETVQTKQGTRQTPDSEFVVSRQEWDEMKAMMQCLMSKFSGDGQVNQVTLPNEEHRRQTGIYDKRQELPRQRESRNSYRQREIQPHQDSLSLSEDGHQYRRHQPPRDSSQSSDDECYRDDIPQLRSWPRVHHGEQRHRPPVNHNRVEKWKLRFTGEPRGMPIENFLYKAKKLAEREGVSRDILLRDIHMLLEGAASDWFFTFVDELVTWDVFESNIVYRFGNPNKDQGIRSRIHERKQQRGESFIAFVTEIEKLNKMLSRPLSTRRKFEIVWDNMRQHYRSKISIVEVKDLQQLTRLNYRIDAADPQLQYQANDNHVRRPINQIDAEESDYDSDHSAPINAIRGRNDTGERQRQTNCHERRGQQHNEQERQAEVYHIKIRVGKCPHIRVKIFDTDWEALLDSGAGISVLNSREVVDRYGLKLQPASIRVSTADGSNYRCLGYVNIPFTFKNMTKVIPTIVVPEISRQLILGADFWEAFGIRPMIDLGNGPETLEITAPSDSEAICYTIEPSNQLPTIEHEESDETLDIPVYEGPTETAADPENIETEHALTDGQRAQLIDVIKKFELTSEGKLGRTHLIEHEIVLKDGVKPRNPPMYKCSPYIQEAINAEVERFKQLDAIEECYSEWTNPLVPVRKKNGKVRVCLDSRKINKLTVKDSYPMRNMQDIFRRLGKAKYFTVIDLKDAYFQIPLKEGSRNYTAFRTAKGVFRFKVLPFGVMNAPFTMSRLMDKALGFDLEPFVFVYLDDIVIASETFEEHLRLLQIVAERLNGAGLTISVEKSRFCRKQVMYLGYLLNKDGLAVDVSRIQPILDYARPRNQEDIRRLMGLAGFYQRFIKDYSRITAPITDLLTKENKKVVWTKEAENGFNELKSVLTSAPILGNPDFTKTFTIESDASDRAVGAALVQEQGGETRVISYFSKKLNRTQRRYSAVEKECLGVLSAIHHFRHYVEGTKFRVITDARSLLWLFNVGAETGNAKLLRWALRIQAYDFDLLYRKGKANITADCLSRAVQIDVIAASQPDAEYEDLMEEIRNNPIKHKDYRIVDGVVYRFVKVKDRMSDPRFEWKQLPTETQKKDVIQREHDKAHFGYEKTLAAIKQRECLTCQVSKSGNVNVTPPMGAQKPVEYPWQFVTLDYVGPLPPSGKNRSTCLLVATDVFSKFVLIQPFREAKANSLAEFVENMIFRLFGVPEIILTDNGSQFVSKRFKDLLEAYHVNHWLTPAYHPQVNNTERVNRVITTAIRATLKKDHKHWADDIQSIANAIRNAVHDSTKYSPYFTVFGRNQVSDGMEYSRMRDNYNSKDDDRRKKLFEEIRTNLSAAYKRHAKAYNLRSNPSCPAYREGERVLKQTFELSDKGKGFCKKLAPKYEPAVVRKVLGTNTYELEDDSGKRIGVYFANRLKKLHSPPCVP